MIDAVKITMLEMENQQLRKLLWLSRDSRLAKLVEALHRVRVEVEP